MIQFMTEDAQATAGVGYEHRFEFGAMRIVAAGTHKRALCVRVGGLVSHWMIVMFLHALVASGA